MEFSYLSNKSSVVSMKNFNSTLFSFPFSVFKGSVLGPLLFILYTSELPRISLSFSLLQVKIEIPQSQNVFIAYGRNSQGVFKFFVKQ